MPQCGTAHPQRHGKDHSRPCLSRMVGDEYHPEHSAEAVTSLEAVVIDGRDGVDGLDEEALPAPAGVAEAPLEAHPTLRRMLHIT